jgi:peptide/nickel transport system substrate-binding protein/oligopeptide transport system substrate-binding protein
VDRLFKKRRSLLMFTIILILSLAFTACGGKGGSTEEVKTDDNTSQEETTKYGGVYQSYIVSDFNTLDPAFATAALDGEIVALLYDALVRFDLDGKVVPGLAKSWELPDDTTLIFDLVDNATFHNGNKVTAQDVKYSFERVLDPAVASPRTWVFDKIKGAKEFMDGAAEEVVGLEVLDDYKLKITLEEPFAPFLSMMGMPAAHIVDKNEIEKYSDQNDYALKPVGTGPYVFVEFKPGDRFVVEANEEYFGGRPFLDGINYRVIKDNSTAIAEFEAGNLDTLSIPSVEIDRFTNNPQYQPYIINNNTFWNYYIGTMNDKAPFDNVNLRKAAHYAINREAILSAVIPNTSVPSHGPIPPGLDGYRSDLKSYPYNIEKAKELLAEEGYSVENPLKIKFYHADSASNVALLEPVQAMLNEVGFDVELVSMEWNAYRAAVRQGEPDMFYLSWGADYPDAENYLYPLFHSSMTDGGGNETRYANPEVDALLELSHKTQNYNERIKLYQKIEDMIIEDSPRIWVYLSRNWNVYKPNVKGVQIYRIFNADKKLDVWFEK